MLSSHNTNFSGCVKFIMMCVPFNLPRPFLFDIPAKAAINGGL
jgi:hypothetical protein